MSQKNFLIKTFKPGVKAGEVQLIFLVDEMTSAVQNFFVKLEEELEIPLSVICPSQKIPSILSIVNELVRNSNVKEKYVFCGVGLHSVSPNKVSVALRHILKDPLAMLCSFPYQNLHVLEKSHFLVGGSKKAWLLVGGISHWLNHPRNQLLELMGRIQYHRQMKIDSRSIFDGSTPKPSVSKEDIKMVAKDQKAYPSVVLDQNHIFQKNPDFILIGTQKSGTTSLISVMKQHPEIHVPTVNWNGVDMNEIHFFSSWRYSNLGAKWYRSLFYHPSKKISGEKTPEYLSRLGCHEKMHSVVPNAKLLITLRNPVERAWSALRHLRREGSGWGNPLLKQGDAREAHDRLVTSLIEDEVVTRGCYWKEIENLLKYYPKEQLLILIHEETLKNPTEARRKIFSFLGVEDLDKISFPHSNKGEKSQEERSPESIQALYDYYQPHNEALFNFIGKKIEEWLPEFK